MKKMGREFLRSRAFRVAVLGCLAVSLLCCTALAVDDTTGGSSATIVSAFQTGFQQIVSDATSIIVVAVPIALGLAGTIFLVKKAMSWFKSMAK